MMDTIRAKRDEIYAVARRHKAEKLWVFGSCACGEETPESDVDLLIKFSPGVSFRDYDALESNLSQIFRRDDARLEHMMRSVNRIWSHLPGMTHDSLREGDDATEIILYNLQMIILQWTISRRTQQPLIETT